MNQKTTKKLAAYSALAAGVVALTGNADAQITYVDINPDQSYNADSQVDIDLNSDGINDFSLFIEAGKAYTGGPVNDIRLSPGSNNMALGSVSGSFFYPFALDLNAQINAAQTVWNGTANGAMLTMAWKYTAGGSYGNWLTAADKYIGVRFMVGSNVYYGWIRLDVTCNASGITVVYKDYAYNTVAEQGILAGQTVVGINDPSALQARVFTAGDVLHLNLNKTVEGEVIITNMLGQAVLKAPVSSMKMELPVDSYDAGIYMVTINSNAGTYTQKIFVK
jgi:hypothetical protein